MVSTQLLSPGVTLRCCPDSRFRQGCLTVQFLTPMTAEDAAVNALIPAILLRGSADYPDLQAITRRLDDLYGAAVGTLNRRYGNCQSVCFACSFLEDRFLLPGDAVFAPLVELLAGLLTRPATENGRFRPEDFQGEQRNLISAIETQRNDKRAYAMERLLQILSGPDSFGVPRLGSLDSARAVTPDGAWAGYRRLMERCPVEVFYVGRKTPEDVASLLRPALDWPREPQILPEPTSLQGAPEGQVVRERMEVTQTNLCLGFTTPVTSRDPRFAAMQVCNQLFGGGMNSRLFQVVREKLGLCYAVSSGYYASKGVLAVEAGIDGASEDAAREEILRQLALCAAGDFSEAELAAAKQSLISVLSSVSDSPGALETYYTSAFLNGYGWSPEEYCAAVRAVTAEDAARAAATLRLHTTYILGGTAS